MPPRQQLPPTEDGGENPQYTSHNYRIEDLCHCRLAGGLIVLLDNDNCPNLRG
jgi:hypothetical protein